MTRWTDLDALAIINYLDEQLRTKRKIRDKEIWKIEVWMKLSERAYIGCEGFCVLENAHQRDPLQRRLSGMR